MIKKSCYKSLCGRYRWKLDITLSESFKELIFVGLNPSLSSEQFTDNTTKKIINISDKYNYGKVKIINLFAFISSCPKRLFTENDPVGNLNDYVIKESLKYWSEEKNCNLWIGWGNNGIYLNRHKYFFTTIKPYFQLKIKTFNSTIGPLHIKKTKNSNPIHPLYCPNNSSLKEFILDN